MVLIIPQHAHQCVNQCARAHTHFQFNMLNIYALPITGHVYNHDNLLHLLGLGQDIKFYIKICIYLFGSTEI